MADTNNIIFSNGVDFVSGIERKNQNSRTPKVSDENFSDALEHILPQIEQTTIDFHSLSEKYRMSKAIIGVKIKPKYLSKTYKISEMYEKTNLERVGSLSINQDKSDAENRTRIEYLRGDPVELDQLVKDMQNNKRVTQKLRAELVRIESIELPPIKAKLQLLPSDWKSGKICLVLHPNNDYYKLIDKLAVLLPEQDKSTWESFKAIDGLTYISMKLKQSELKSLAPFNPLRQVMPTLNSESSIQIEGDFSTEINVYTNDAYRKRTTDLISVGEIDGGFRSNGTPYMSDMKEIAAADTSKSNFYVEHGTAVGSILMYGNLDQIDPSTTITTSSRVKVIRVLPTEKIKVRGGEAEDFDFVKAANLIKETIPKHLDVKVWNVSVGPFGPILDEVAPLTAALDELAFKYHIIFCVAVGNTGEVNNNFYTRIQTPADMVNGIGVGSFEYDDVRKPRLAPYTSTGPGREGAIIKPDFLAHGGGEQDKLLTFSTDSFNLNRVYGTSFASPTVANLATQLLNASTELTALDAKALLIHQASLNPLKDYSLDRVGRGAVTGISESLKSANNEYRILYSSEMSTNAYAKLEIPIPNVDDLKSTSLEFSWTVSIFTNVAASESDEYTQCTIEDSFYADSKKFIYRKDGSTLRKSESDPSVERLLQEGWKKSAFPAPNGKKYAALSEYSQRSYLKWDTVKNDRVTKRVTSINNPFLILHALSRDGSHYRVPYSVVVTVRAVQDNDLYQQVQAQHAQLQPLNVDNQVMTRI